MNNEELVKSYQNGDKDSLLELWDNNQGLIHKIVNGFCGYADEDDLMQEAFLALNNASNEYKHDAGCSFASFLADRIRWSLISYLENNGNSVKLSRSMWGKISKYNKTINALREALGRAPKDEEIAREMGLSVNAIHVIETAICKRATVSMNAPISQESEGVTIADMIADPENDIEKLEDQIDDEKLKQTLWGIVDTELSPMQAEVIHKTFQEELTQEETARAIGIQCKTVHSAKVCALRRLKNARIKSKLEPYLEGYILPQIEGRSSMSHWKNTGMSAQEWAVIKLEEKEKDLIGRAETEKPIINCDIRSFLEKPGKLQQMIDELEKAVLQGNQEPDRLRTDIESLETEKENAEKDIKHVLGYLRAYGAIDTDSGEIIKMKYIKGLSMTEIYHRLGGSREYIYRKYYIVIKAIEELRA